MLSHLGGVPHEWTKSMPDNDEIAWLHAPCETREEELVWTLEARDAFPAVGPAGGDHGQRKARLRSALRGVGT